MLQKTFCKLLRTISRALEIIVALEICTWDFLIIFIEPRVVLSHCLNLIILNLFLLCHF